MKCDADICKNLQVNVEFLGGITIDFLTMPRTISMPQIGGLVQRREVTSVGLESLLDNDGLIVGSVSPRPTYFGRYSFDYRLLDEASSTDQCTGGTLVRGGVSLQISGHLFSTCGRTSTCRAGSLRGSCSSFLSFSPYVIPGGDARKVTHERRRFPWRLVWAISFVQASETIFVRFLNSPVERDTVLALYRMQCKDISTQRRQNCAFPHSGSGARVVVTGFHSSAVKDVDHYEL